MLLPPELQVDLPLLILLWARLAALFLLSPWVAFGIRPGVLALALSGASACALAPLALAQHPSVIPYGLPLLAAALQELLRGSVLGLGCALPFAVLRSTGGLADVLRGAIPAGTEQAGILAGLYALAALVAALGLSAQLGVVRLIVESLQIAPLGSEITELGGNLRSLSDWIFQAFELGVTLGAPLLLSAWLAALLCGLLLRAAGPIVAPWPSTLLPWFGLAIVCLSIAGTLDEIPGVVRLFSRETRRVLEALH